MIKPTPTPLPPGTPYFILPDGYGLWASTDTAIQYWHWLGEAQTILQLIIVIFLVIVFIVTVVRWVNVMMEEDSKR
ncbi:MAG: hypothetical protein L6Q98_24610 [Anaerolineae bacterium]|nr:hypothetical protein [Anaerolineae bacterium]NUQ07161.1 hypothetical protein [Anaerolineae bacterium]